MQTLAGAMAVISLYVAATIHQRSMTIHLLRENQARLEEADRMKTSFLNKAAHELRTPLTPIQLQVRLLESKMEGDGDAGPSLLIVRRNVERMASIIAKLVAAARIDDEVRAFHPLATDLHALASEATADVAEAAARRHVTLRVQTDRGETTLDRRAWSKVLHELLENAVRFAPEAGHVTLEARHTRGGGSRWSVTDDGPGVPAARRERIFEPFTQDDQAQLGEGHGLGLYIARALVAGHGGGLWVEDAPQGGARFIAEIPGSLAPATAA
jgi:signal transduction histidine kinase